LTSPKDGLHAPHNSSIPAVLFAVPEILTREIVGYCWLGALRQIPMALHETEEIMQIHHLVRCEAVFSALVFVIHRLSCDNVNTSLLPKVGSTSLLFKDCENCRLYLVNDVRLGR